ncbi:MAG: hypothetical protein HYY09_02450 [Firmicutes bacterium]|nr:hypothetical protein [Bacillota bacterium]
MSEIEVVLEQAAACEHLADALYRGIFGTRDDGVYPGRGGIGSLVTAQPAGFRPGAGMMDDSPASPNPGTGFPAGEGCRSREGSRS